jgi:hypothetical protein
MGAGPGAQVSAMAAVAAARQNSAALRGQFFRCRRLRKNRGGEGVYIGET